MRPAVEQDDHSVRLPQNLEISHAEILAWNKEALLRTFPVKGPW
jgi:hypothetical protein